MKTKETKKTVQICIMILFTISIGICEKLNNSNLKTDIFGKTFKIRENLLKREFNYDYDIRGRKDLVNPEIIQDMIHKSTENSWENSWTKHLEDLQSLESSESLIKCEPGNSGPFRFGATKVGQLKSQDNRLKIETYCYKNLDIKFIWRNKNTLSIYTVGWWKKSILCPDSILIHFGNHIFLQTLMVPGVHVKNIEGLSEFDKEFIKYKGIEIYKFCNKVTNILPSIFNTARLFLGGLGSKPYIPFFGSKVPMYMQELNAKFIKQATGYQWKKRKIGGLVQLDESYIKNGDVLLITRMDGLDNIIHWGSGSHTGHCVMALWDESGFEPVLYIVESQDAWYWPTKGIQKTKYKDWIHYAHNADFNVIHLPLSQKARFNFDVQAAWRWFNKTEGMPYGFRNFLFTFWDTPTENFPEAIDINFVTIIFKVLENISFLKGDKGVDRVVKEALNWRIGTKNLSISELDLEIAKRNLTIAEVGSIPEKDYIEYSDGYSYVCSSYVISLYKEGGLFKGLEINPSEFTPRDLYMLTIFDSKNDRPQACVEADPELPYCQLMGDWIVEIPGWNTVVPYNKMNERCPSLAPEYERPRGC